jgi:4-carboxymuconolactone decarboxylase
MAASKSYEERHASAAETFTVFAPGVEPERISASFARRLGALGGMAFDVVGAMWARPQLSRRDRSLLVISVLAAQARDDELEAHTGIGLTTGLKREEIEEVLLHVAALAGFPAAMAASRRIDKALLAASGAEALSDRAPAAAKSDAERDRDGAAALATIDPGGSLAAMEAQLGEVGVIAHRWDFGEIWSRPQLSLRDRSIVVIAILVWLGATAELERHAHAGLRHGLTQVEIEEVVGHLALYAGLPRAAQAMATVRAAFAKADGAR